MGLLATGLVTATPVQAHVSDPRIVAVVQQVRPELPGPVGVRTQPGLATQLVVSNPTATPLEVLGTGGRPFLRLSSAGVYADLASADYTATADPEGTPPTSAGTAAARWVQLSARDSWGWYDHRLHPTDLPEITDEQQAARLAAFTVPVRYGRTSTEIRGQLLFQPLPGSFSVTADPAPQGLVVQVLPGRTPGLFLADPQRQGVVVLGRDDEPFLRFTGAGVQVNTASRTHVEDRWARGQTGVGPPGPTASFALAAPQAVSYQWLDIRLRHPDAVPPESVLRSDDPTELSRWRVPVLIDGKVEALTGAISWVPDPAAVGRPDTGPAPAAGGSLPLALAGASLALLVAVVAVRRRRRTSGSAQTARPG